MSPRQTWLLLAVLGGLGLADALAWREVRERRSPLPALEAHSGVQWVVLHQGDARLRLERRGSGWEVVHPFRFPADPAAVRQILAVIERGVRPDSRAGDGELDRYGLAGAEPVRVEAGSGDRAEWVLYVGHQSHEGSTWIRFAESDAVYLARVGGRARYARAAREWRDRQVWRVDARALASLSVERSDGQSVELVAEPSGWAMAGDPDFPVDPALAREVGSTLADLRAEQVYTADHPFDPTGRLVLTGTDGSVREAQLGTEGDTGLVTVEGREGVYTIPGRLVHRLLADRDAWRDRTLWTVDPASVVELEWIDEQGSVRAARDPRSGQWVSRSGTAIDPRAVAAAAGFLAQARVEDFVALEESGLPGARSVVIVADKTHTLQIGELRRGILGGRDAITVRDPARPDRIGLVEAQLVERLSRAFRP